MLNCAKCKYYDASVDACNADDKCFMDGYDKGRTDAIEFISDKLIYPLLDEYDRSLWEHINYIELAEAWVKALDDNPCTNVEDYTEAIKRDLRQWIAEQLKEQNNE